MNPQTLLKVFLVIVLLSVLLVIGSFVSLSHSDNHVEMCNALRASIEQEENQDLLEKQASELVKLDNLETKLGLRNGFIRFDQLKSPNIFNWKKFGISNASAALRLIGDNINYNLLKESEVGAVAIGNGGRSFIIYDIDNDGDFFENDIIVSDSEIIFKSEKFMVVCRGI